MIPARSEFGCLQIKNYIIAVIWYVINLVINIKLKIGAYYKSIIRFCFSHRTVSQRVEFYNLFRKAHQGILQFVAAIKVKAHLYEIGKEWEKQVLDQIIMGIHDLYL